MSKKDTKDMINDFNGFEALSGALLQSQGSALLDMDDIPETDPDDIVDDVDEDEEDIIDEKPDEEIIDDTEEEVDESTKEEDETPEEDVSGLSDDDESAVTQFFQEKLADKLKWDLEEDEKFKTVDEMVDYMEEVVNSASKPSYANEEIEKLNEFVSNGGNLKDFYAKTYSNDLDIESLDLSEVEAQRSVIREGLKTLRSYKEDRISKIIQRYEDAGVLEDEAEDTVELLKDHQSKKEERLLDDQKNEAQVVKNQQQKFFTNVKDAIDDMDDIMGVSVSKKEKEDLLDYMFKPDKDGMTRYQKEYSSDIRHLLQSAFFTQKGSTLFTKAKKSASSNAAKELHQRLKASKDKRSKGSTHQNDSSKSDSLNLLGNSLLRKV